MLYTTYMIFSFRCGVAFPKAQPILAFCVLIAVALELSLIIGAPFILRFGSGQAQPFLVVIWLIKVCAFLA